MNFRDPKWYPVAAGLSALNIGAVWFAAQPGEPFHAAGHAALAVAFGLWAQRLRQRPRVNALEAELDAMQLELNTTRQELGEAQERLDFAERMLAQAPAARPLDQPR